jgi:hypothetical protein
MRLSRVNSVRSECAIKASYVDHNARRRGYVNIGVERKRPEVYIARHLNFWFLENQNTHRGSTMVTNEKPDVASIVWFSVEENHDLTFEFKC